ncbi:haloacid dehalogenase-like hydrolase (HAD) superfamily protein [Tasmannia lanceolata]|uniref:haloacid dehalogenase-like hydrolase (HAD) superfamily protein n=1 Tax=Tasmannia lanceolata TaxID=3420 RepID=UPI0040641008
MVSKIIKETPTKLTKDRRPRYHRKKTPLKKVIKASSIVISTINRSICKCQSRILKLFTTLSTPIRRKNGYRRLKKIPKDDSPASAWPISGKLLPPAVFPEKKTVFLDLDETLIHSKSDPPPEKFDFIVRPKINGEILNFYVLKRPGVDELLEEMGKRFEIVVFTAGLREYASLVLDRLDSEGVISHRLYRDSCKEMEGRFVKDLSEMGRDLKRVVIVDDNPSAYVFQPENAVPMRQFIDDLGDRELWRVMKFLEFADCFEDMRDAVGLFVSDGNFVF